MSTKHAKWYFDTNTTWFKGALFRNMTHRTILPAYMYVWYIVCFRDRIYIYGVKIYIYVLDLGLDIN